MARRQRSSGHRAEGPCGDEGLGRESSARNGAGPSSYPGSSRGLRGELRRGFSVWSSRLVGPDAVRDRKGARSLPGPMSSAEQPLINHQQATESRTLFRPDDLSVLSREGERGTAGRPAGARRTILGHHPEKVPPRPWLVSVPVNSRFMASHSPVSVVSNTTRQGPGSRITRGEIGARRPRSRRRGDAGIGISRERFQSIDLDVNAVDLHSKLHSVGATEICANPKTVVAVTRAGIRLTSGRASPRSASAQRLFTLSNNY